MIGTPGVNIEAEQALLGALLVNNETLAVACNSVEPEHFSEPVHSRIFEATATLIRAGKLASPVTLKAYFERDATLEEIGGTAYLARLARAATTTVNAPEYASLVRSLATQRTARDILADAVDGIIDLPVDQSPEEYLATVSSDLLQIAEKGDPGKTTVNAAQGATAALDAAAEAYRLGGKRPGSVLTGLPSLDELIGGFVPGNLITVGARPSVGKSAFGAHCSWRCALMGTTSLFISLEMTTPQIFARFLSMHSGVAYSRIEQGRFSEDEYHALTLARDELAKLPLFVDDRSWATPADIASLIARTKRKFPDLALVVIDYLGLIKPGERYRGRKVDEVSEITAALKQCAKRHAVPIVLLAQLSRGPEGRENKRATLADLRDSGSIEQDSDIVIFPHREDYYLAHMLKAAVVGSAQEIELTDRLRECRGKMELAVAKNRQGPTGTAHVLADMGTNRITDAEERMLAAA